MIFVKLAGEKSIFSGDGNAGRSGVHIVGQGERVIFSFCEGSAIISDANRWSDRFSGISLIRNCGDASIAFQGNKRAGSCIVSAEGDTDGRDLFRAGIFGGRERIVRTAGQFRSLIENGKIAADITGRTASAVGKIRELDRLTRELPGLDFKKLRGIAGIFPDSGHCYLSFFGNIDIVSEGLFHSA